jgi:hypothetical protein
MEPENQTEIKNLPPPVEMTYDELQEAYCKVLVELSDYKHGKVIRRPIALPNDLTLKEYNWMVDYLKDQRVKILNHKADIPKKIKEN